MTTGETLRILFVDDEQAIIDGLRRNLHAMRREWHMRFASSGEEALAMLDTKPADVVISDMRMPGMDGAELLSEVRKRLPATIRIVLSGHAEVLQVMRTVNIAHCYLSKPTEAGELRAIVHRCRSLRNMLEHEDIAALVSSIQTLPSPPEVYQRLLAMLRSDDCSAATVASLVDRDPVMTSKILKMVNSSFFGLKRTITRSCDAIGYLGMETVKALALSAEIFRTIDHQMSPELERLWDHSTLVGHMARAVMEVEEMGSPRCDEAYTAGLLHDIGKIILATRATERYRTVLDRHAEGTELLYRLERLEFGVSHAQVGGYLLGIWSLPDEVVEAVAFHHQPQLCSDDRFSILSAVHVANAFYHLYRHREDPLAKQKLNSLYLHRIGATDKLGAYGKACAQALAKAQDPATA